MATATPAGQPDYRRPGIWTFATLDALDSMSRASLVTLVPLEALVAFKDARDVSLVFTIAGVAGLLAMFAIPAMLRISSRRIVYSLGPALVILAVMGFATASQVGVAAGIFLRSFATSCVVIGANLYVLDYIHKRDFVRLEPIRIMAIGIPWGVGPFLGVWLHEEFGPLAAYGLPGGMALLVLAYFWSLRMREGPAAATLRRPRTPWASIVRFASQPRLRLAWAITFGRSSWWAMFFIYLPLYMVEAGQGELAGALMISGTNFLLLIAPAFGWLARRVGLRRVFIVSFLCAGTASIAAGLLADFPMVAAGLILVGAIGPIALDGLAALLFYRAVRSWERAEMMTVYSSWRDLSQLATPAVCALALTLGPLSWVFLTMGAAMFVFAWLARYVPRRM